MRIKAIQLSWFRGAADPVSLEPNCKSMVVYGSNGAGKSCFVDAFEYAMNDGRIDHLAHEYSGRRQEKAVPNTHTPKDRNPSLSIKFSDDAELKIAVIKDGSYTRSGGEAVAIHDWEYRRTILRQHEVAHFIQSTKGSKYSALLPLLGLSSIELVAGNLRQLKKAVEEQSQLASMRQKLAEVEMKRKETFGTDTHKQIIAEIRDLHTKYCPDKSDTVDTSTMCEELKASIDTLIRASTADQRRYIALNDAARLDLKTHIDAVRTASGELAGDLEPLVAEKLEVLQSTGAYVDKLEDATTVDCPACGRPFPVDAFEAHIKAERERLHEIINTFNTRKTAIGTLCNTVRSLQSTLKKTDLKSWWDALAQGALAESFAFLDKIDSESLRKSCGEDELKPIEVKLLPLIDIAISSSKDAPPDAQELSTANQRVEVVSTIIAVAGDDAAVNRADALISFINVLEKGLRQEIKTQAQKVIDDISSDIQGMWGILHPDEPIEGVRLYLPTDADKAIDIRLKFHGVDQDSPRLTLSEGCRNSLGLCIFLAMAKRESANDRPMFLDDVVVSFDRNHRGMIAQILNEEFSQRQVIVLTHDRDWYTDLRAQLNPKVWEFKMLLPYESPTIGIRWSHKTTTFDDARALLKDRPDSAGNDARKIMDVELATIAERLYLLFPFLRGDKNDKRMAHDFLEQLIAAGKKYWMKRAGSNYESFTVGIGALEAAGMLLTSWGNRGSHSFDVVRPEAAKLIDACEAALEGLKCKSCLKQVWYADVAAKDLVQCECGELRWRYGKE